MPPGFCRLITIAFALASAALALAGCNPFAQPSSLTEEYVERVARVLEAEADVVPLPVVAALPRRRDRVRELPSIDIGLLEFFSLYGCELQQVVGEKNSALGRVMQPAQRLEYEIRFLHAANECLPTITDPELHQTLAQAIKTKREALPLAIWNATWGSAEMAGFFTRSQGALPLTPDANALATLTTDLNRLNAWVRQAEETDRPELFTGLSEIHQRWRGLPIAGQLVQSARLLIARLDAAERLLARKLQGRPVCFNQKPNRKAEIMRNVFLNIYAAQVQPYMAQVQRIKVQILPALRELFVLQAGVAPSAMAPFFAQVLEEAPGSLWHALDEGMRRHTERWQDLLDQCGMRPQA